MTTRTLLLDSPFLLGFEHTQRLIERAARGQVKPIHLIMWRHETTVPCALPWPWPDFPHPNWKSWSMTAS